MDSTIFEKLSVLGDGAKYDVSCSSSGADRTGVGRIGSAACAGICHTWGADGRCISLLKVLLSNDCVYDCQYCVNRRSADVTRRSFEPVELANLTIEFYRRNYIEGLFLSSAVLKSPENTVEKMAECLRMLREDYGFAGYIHAKVIPGVPQELLYRIGLYADRLSVNIEVPSEESLKTLAPQKNPRMIFGSMRQITQTQAAQKTLKAAGFMKKLNPAFGTGSLNLETGDGSLNEMIQSGNNLHTPVSNPLALVDMRKNYKEKFAPAGQTTQMIIGASPESDRHIMSTSEALYHKFSMKRVYYSAYVSVADSPDLPPIGSPSPLLREHRLYQADFLLRFYGFSAGELLTEKEPNLDYDYDPKVVWALRNMTEFPIEINKADLESLLRIPGIGVKSAQRILRQRRISAVGYDDLKKMGVVLKRARFFLTCSGKYYGDSVLEPYYIRDRLKPDNGLLLDSSAVKIKLNGDASRQVSFFDELAEKPKTRQPITAKMFEVSGAMRDKTKKSALLTEGKSQS